MDKFLDQLQEEIKNWAGKGIISETQKDTILKEYSKEYQEEQLVEKRGKLVAILSTLGAILVGTGVILFFASNWDKISPFQKTIIIYILLFSSYFIGFRLKYLQGKYPKTGISLIFLGCILYGAAIWLIAQIFHIKAHWPNGLLAWAMFVLPISYIIQSRAILTISLIDIILWLGFEMSFQFGGFFEDLYYPFYIYFLFGIFIYSIGLIHTKFESKYDALYRFFGLVLILGVVYFLTFKFHKTIDITKLQLFGISYKLISLFAIFPLIFVIFNLKKNLLVLRKNLLVLLQTGTIIVSLFVIFVFSSYESEPRVLIYNLLLFLLIVGLVFLGYFEKRNFLINIALLFFAIDVITRYFDFFWEYLPKSIFFIVGGLILMYGGFLIERARRKIIKKISQ